MIWNFERPLVFAHIFLKNTLSIRRFREIISKITSRMDLWNRGLQVGLAGEAEAESDARGVRAAKVAED